MIKACTMCIYGRRIKYNAIDGSGCTNPHRKDDWGFYSICQKPPCPTWYPDLELTSDPEFKGSDLYGKSMY